MKCISEFGYFFLRSLGTGVVNITSPNEENLIIKIFKISNIYFFLLIFYPIISIKSQSKHESLINQKNRIEYEVGYLNRNYFVSSNNKTIILVRDYETGKEIKWNMTILNQDLLLEKDTSLNLDRSLELYKIIPKDKYYHLFFKKNYSNDKVYTLIKYDFIENNIFKKDINLPLSLEIVDILIYNNKLVFYSNTRNKKNLISIYDFISNQLINIYEYLYYESDIIKLERFDEDNFLVLVSERENNLKILERRIYNLNGIKENTFKSNSDNYSLLNSKKYLNEDFLLSISLIAEKNSNESQGIQIEKIFEDKDYNLKSINFLDINAFKDSISILNKGLNKKLKSKKNIRLGYEFFIDSIFRNNNTFYVSLETLKANFNNDGFSNYSYMPFYNTYSGTYDRKVNPNFGGYSHEISILISFDSDLESISISAFETNKFDTFYKKPYYKYLISDNKILNFYVNKGKIFISTFNKITKKTTRKNINISIKNEDNILIKTETNPEGLRHWYTNDYITYGIQKVKLKNGKNKRVFFVTNFEIIL